MLAWAPGYTARRYRGPGVAPNLRLTLLLMNPTERFVHLVGGAEADLPLDEAALLIAAHAHPDLDVAAGLAALDQLAAAVPSADVDGLRHQLFTVEGFCGNKGDYYDPENSFLDTVLSRRTGIPITLSVVLLEVGRRVGVPLVGVGMPGHFLVGTTTEPALYVDAFEGGVVLDRDGCAARFAAVTGGQRLDPAALTPVGPRAILARMLGNLGGVARQRRDRALLQWVLHLRAAIPSQSLAERRDLAGALASSGRFDEAADVLEAVADAMVVGPDHELRRQAAALRAKLN